MKLAKAADHLTSSPTQRALCKNEDGSPDILSSSPTTVVPSFTTRAVTAQDDMKIDGHVSYHQSPLSRQVSHSLDKSSEDLDSTSLGIQSHSQKDSASLESYVSKGQFHFSIYKWAGKGVTLVMPSKSNLQHEGRFKRLPEVVVQEVDVILHEDDTSTLTAACENQCDILDEAVRDVSVETKVDADSTTVKGLLHAEFKSKIPYSDETEKSGSLLLVIYLL